MKALTVGSLFSGIGGLDLGFERAGFVIKWQVEIDPYCRRVLHKHWPAVPCYEDVRTVGAHNLEPVDVLVGGFPCQDISIAGKGAGIDGERSGLWREYARLIGELRPRYSVVENVPALFHRGLDVVLGELAARGYDAEWDVLSACRFGAPHTRERVFVVGYPRGLQGRVWAPVDTWQANSRNRQLFAYEWAVEGRPRFNVGRASSGIQRGAKQDTWAPEPCVPRVVDGVPFQLERIRGLGNAVVPQVAQYVAECVKAHAERCEA